MNIGGDLRGWWGSLQAHRTDLLYRVGIGLFMLVWLHAYPLYLLILYSAKRGFLSFDLLTNGLIGINSVLAWTAAFLLLLALYQWGFFALLLVCLKHRAELKRARRLGRAEPVLWGSLRSRWVWAGAFILSGGAWFFLLVAAANAQPAGWGLLLSLSVFTAALCVCMLGFVRGSLVEAALNWQAPLLFTILSMFAPLVGHDAAAGIIDVGLRQFRIGGGLHTVVERFDAEAGKALRQEGRLLLLSEHNIYLETAEGPRRKLVVLANSQNLKIEIDKTYGSNPR